MPAVNAEDRLQKYFDGELSGDEAEAVRRELEADADLRAKLDGLAHLRDMVRVHARAEEADVDSEAMWKAIEARMGEDIVDDEPMFPTAVRPERPALEAVKGGQKAEPKRARVWLGIVGTITAAAAAVLLYVQPWNTGTQIVTPPPGSEIEEVDFGYSTGAVFSVEGQEGARYAVVWISDEKPETETTGERIQ